MAERFNDNYKVWKLMKYCSNNDKDKLKATLESSDYGIQKKIDGSSYILAKDLDGSVHLYKDSISKKTNDLIDKIDNVPHIKDFIEKEFPVGTQIIGELYSNYDFTTGDYHDREESKYLNSIMLSLPAKAIKRQNEVGLVKCYLFDILYYDGAELYKEPFRKRDEFLNNLYSNWTDYKWLSKAETFIENKEDKICEWLEAGSEGGVLKRLDGRYFVNDISGTAKRPAGISLKVKEIDSIDAFVVDIDYPDKEYKGKEEVYKYQDEEGNNVNRLWYLNMANGVTLGVLNDKGETEIIGTCASGFNDVIRKDMVDNPDNYIGRVAVIECMSLDKANHTLRHPRFLNWHADKVKEDCLASEVFK